MVLAVLYVSAFVGLPAVPLVALHASLYGFNLLQASLAIFNAINALICCWEIGLFFYRKPIRAKYEALRRDLKPNELPSPMFMFLDVSLSEALTLKYWALHVWSTYSLLDPSYSDQTAFGFFVDVGNGFVTLIPSILCGISMTWSILPARLMGVIGILKYYQEMYGTVIYFLSFVLNERYLGKSPSAMSVVILSNCIWIVFPLLGMYSSYHLINSNDYSIFR